MIVANTEENLAKCICATCPTYTACMRERKEGLFCAKGETGCDIPEEDECVCARCPIDGQYKLTARLDLMEKKILKLNQFYCIKGPAGIKK